MRDRPSNPNPSSSLRNDCSSDVDELAQQLKYDIQPEQEIQPETDSPPSSDQDQLQASRSAKMARADQNAGDGVGQAAEEA